MEELCKYPGCAMPKGKALGWCNAHYSRARKGSDMAPPVRNHKASEEERFWAKVDKSGDCWKWMGAMTRGYGSFRYQGAARLAHRVAYIFGTGNDPTGYEVDHMCFTKICVNPLHLRLASHSLNGQNRESANSNSKTGVRGVFWCNTYKTWMAKATLNRKIYHLGRFSSVKEADEAISQWRREHMPYSINDQRTGV